MSAQPSELSARLIDLFGNPLTADPTKLYGNLTVNPNGTVQIGTGLVLPDGTNVTAAALGRNRVINGDMVIWQRATTITGTLSGYQTVDRFGCSTQTGSGHNAALSTDAPVGFAYSWKFTVGTGAAPAAGAFQGVWHNIEGFNVADFNYGTANSAYGVLSFWVKASVAGTYALSFMNGTLARNYIATYTISNANTWQQCFVVVPGDVTGTWTNTNTTGLSICWDLGCGSNSQTAGGVWATGQMYGTPTSTKLISTSGATFQLTGVQFEKGQVARPFERNLYSQQLVNCWRYYQGSILLFQSGYGASSANWTWTFTYPVTMRATPTAAITGASYSNGSGLVINNVASNNCTPQFTITATGNGLVNGSMTLNAEL